MKKYKYNIALSLILMLFLPLFMVSCDEESVVEAPRLFRPALFTSSINGSEVTLTWVPIANASYSLEVSRDSFLFENELQVIPLDELSKYKLTDLWSLSRYSARIKSVSKDASIDDSEWNQITFKTGQENILYSIGLDDIGFDYVNLKWDKSKIVTHIIVSSEGSSDRTVTLSSEDITSGMKRIEGLNSGTKYILKICRGEQIRGQATVTTYSRLSNLLVDQTVNAVWKELGNFYFFADKNPYVEINNNNTVGNVMADAFKFSREGLEDVIIDNTDSGVTTVGTWSTSTYSAARIGANYFHDGNTNKGLCSIKYSPVLPVSGVWKVYIYFPGSSTFSKSTPVVIYSGN
jgi:hypothetical protein